MRLARGAAGVYELHALRIPCGDCKIGLTNSTEERAVFLLKTVFIFVGTSGFVFLVAASSSLDCEVDVVVQKNCHVRLQSATEYFMQLQDGLGSQLAAASLIGLGGIREAIAQ